MSNIYMLFSFVLNYYCFALFFYCFFTFSNLRIEVPNLDEKYNVIITFIYCLTWVISMPCLIIVSLKRNKNIKK